MSNEKKYSLLVVDDDAEFCKSFKFVVPENWVIDFSTSLTEIPDTQNFDAAFVDVHLSQRKEKSPEGP